MALQGLWTLQSMVLPGNASALVACVPLAYVIAYLARRRHGRVPTLLSQFATYIQLYLAEAGLSQAHWVAGGGAAITQKLVIMTLLGALLGGQEVASRRRANRQDAAEPEDGGRPAPGAPTIVMTTPARVRPRRPRGTTKPRRPRRTPRRVAGRPGIPPRENTRPRPRPAAPHGPKPKKAKLAGDATARTAKKKRK
ncbi:hypothetical protein [Amycolatopsis camponoti]|uniref:hypothetical protein n=1 Tax=Amycolatopsis camponoti TaxID=2606593 RepID=UPI0012D7F44F|nr:hypothetical protein [Amycolatopsis camponoti]